jgi:murein DD-endopeptidase MepM/ murein hydrolase activator NlpD
MTIGAVMRASAGATCPACGANVDVKNRHVAVTGGAIRIYCSEQCLRARNAPPVPITPSVRPRRRIWWIAGGLIGGTTSFLLAYGLGEADPANNGAPTPWSTVEAATRVSVAPAPRVTVEETAAAAQRDRDQEADAALVTELAHDTWIHPLAGPTRRMPIIPDAAFGALRPGQRPLECVSGHCGVDIGNAWGEPVHAVHDGVVDWVNRGPNDLHGGIFVKIAHRDGTLYSWYFHLAAVPRWVQPGAKVKLGQVIGLLGDTGVGRTGAHLHFSLSVKPAKTAKERYIDPESLIAIWPLWVANDNEAGRVTTLAAPGTPVRQDGWRPYRRPPAAAATSAAGNAAAAAPATDAPSPEAAVDPGQ